MTNSKDFIPSKFVYDIAKIAQEAAIGASKMRGQGDEKLADKAAVDAMRNALNEINIKGRVVIGEGERDEAPMLYIGEEVGTGNGPEIDIALDPLEGTTLCAKNQANSLAVIAMAKKGNLLYAPDVYMEKLAIGPGYLTDVVHIDNSPEVNIQNLAKAKGVSTSDIKVCIMDRDRHADMIAKVRTTGAQIKLIGDGDVAAVIETAKGNIDIYMGIGGAPEGVLASAALRCIGGQMYGRLILDTAEKLERAKNMGIVDGNKIYRENEMAKGNVIFAAAGVTNGELLKGVDINKNRILTECLVMCSDTKSTHHIKTETSLV